MTSDQKKDYALQLFLHGNITQQEIAERVGVTVQTISSWKKKFGWEKLKKSLLTTRKAELARLYDQLSELNTHIQDREAGQRYASTGEADTIGKLTKAIRNLETETSIAQTVDVFIEFSEFLQDVDLDKAKEFFDLQDAYLKTKM